MLEEDEAELAIEEEELSIYNHALEEYYDSIIQDLNDSGELEQDSFEQESLDEYGFTDSFTDSFTDGFTDSFTDSFEEDYSESYEEDYCNSEETDYNYQDY